MADAFELVPKPLLTVDLAARYAPPGISLFRVYSRFVRHLWLVPSPADPTFLAFFPAQTVEIDDHDNEDTGDDSLPEGIHVQQIGAIVDRGQNEGA